jgi:uncharacterized protein (TIGR02246 family)
MSSNFYQSSLLKIVYMRFICFLIVFFTVSLRGLSQEDKIYDAKDLAALKSLPVQWESYWNNHNMDSLGTLLQENVDFVNLAGLWLKGKVATMKLLTMVHQTTYKNSVWTTDSIELKYVTPDLAILHIGWGISGDTDPDGTPRKPKHGIFTWMVIQGKGQWLLLEMDNVSIR